MSNRKTLISQGAWFFFFNSILFLLISTRYFHYFAKIDSFITAFYLVIATLSHFIGLSFICFLVLYLPAVAIYPKRKFAWIWAAIVASIGVSWLYIDSIVFQLYRFHINKFVLELLFGGGASQIFQFSIYQYLLILGIYAIGICVLLFCSKKIFSWQEKKPLKGGVWVITISALMMLGSHFIHAWADAANYCPITKSSRYYPLYFPTSAKNLMLKIGMVDAINQDNYAVCDGENARDINYPRHQLEMSSNCKTNIILILIDSWYYKAFDSITQPNIYRFSKKCEVYQHHYSGSNGTRTGVFSIFYSIPGTYWDDMQSTQTGSILVDALLKNNYDIKTYASATLTSPPFNRTIFRKVRNLHTETKGDDVCSRDNQITADWLNTTKNYSGKQPVFGFLFYDALHAVCHPKNFKGPFQPEWEYAKYEELDNNTDPTQFLNLYKNSARYVDSLVGRVLDDLEARGMLKNSWVIITGDHGQEFNDNKKNYWGHNGNYSAAQMQIPFLIYKPGIKPKTYKHWSCHYDIVPTIFTELFKCKNPISDYSIGRLLSQSTPTRNYLLVGSKDNFGIVEPNKITNVYFNGNYDITDAHLNEFDNARIDGKFFNKVMLDSKIFYK